MDLHTNSPITLNNRSLLSLFLSSRSTPSITPHHLLTLISCGVPLMMKSMYLVVGNLVPLVMGYLLVPLILFSHVVPLETLSLIISYLIPLVVGYFPTLLTLIDCVVPLVMKSQFLLTFLILLVISQCSLLR